MVPFAIVYDMIAHTWRMAKGVQLGHPAQKFASIEAGGTLMRL